MPNMITCRCGQRLQTNALAGQHVRCPACGNVMEAPGEPSGFAAPLPSQSQPPVASPFGASPTFAAPNYSAGNQSGLWPDPPAKQGLSTGALVALVLGGVALALLLVCGGAMWMVISRVQTAMKEFEFNVPLQGEELSQHDEDYAQARQNFRTELLRVGPSPQEHEPSYRADLQPIRYRSGDLILSAYVDPPAAAGPPRPAVLFLHSGFAFGPGDYEMPQPYRDAGFIVMQPLLRGENGQPGEFTMLYDEVDDVLAAAEALAALPYVDRNRLFVAGHMEGGTLAVLAAMTSTKFRGAASLSASMNLAARQNHTYNHYTAPFDAEDPLEFEMRSPIAFPGSFKCPARLYFGANEFLLAASTARTAELAQGHGLDVVAESIPGDQVSSVPASIQKSILFFNQLPPRDSAEPAAAPILPAEGPAEPQ